MTHDLMTAVLEAFSVVPEQVVVSELRDRTFFAEIYLRGSAGVEMVSARPSDAIALAVRTGAQIFVAVEVLEEAGYVAPSDGDEPVAEVQVEEFRAFLDTVNPDDFAGG
jgi:bifunctional DNase/RNase